jgi:hypothetical protein
MESMRKMMTVIPRRVGMTRRVRRMINPSIYSTGVCHVKGVSFTAEPEKASLRNLQRPCSE